MVPITLVKFHNYGIVQTHVSKRVVNFSRMFIKQLHIRKSDGDDELGASCRWNI